MNYTTNQLRILFRNFFQNKGFAYLESYPLIPMHDPSLLFINAGMAPLKQCFLTPSQASHTQLSSIQKCFRAGGKHNDLLEVGFTPYHHTFFEMCGCFSFDSKISKEQMMQLSYDFLINEIKLNKENLRFSYLPEDHSTLRRWKSITKLGEKHFFTDEENIWSMGDTGPYGTCTEIFYQLGDDLVEIWNIVFMSHQKLASGELIALPTPCIDTGMGLERLAAIVQGVDSTYKIDIFHNLFKTLQAESQNYSLSAVRVMSDHLRAAVMLAAEGLIPGPEGRPYVMRRLIRRALIFAQQAKMQDHALSRNVPLVIQAMQDGYPELQKQELAITQSIFEEENKFYAILLRSEKLLALTLKGDIQKLSGEIIFDLYSTHGIPIEVIEDACAAGEIKCDTQAFRKILMKSKQQQKSFNKLECITPSSSKFLGYELTQTTATLQGIYQDRGEHLSAVDMAVPGDQVIVVLDQTVFYPESGGQQGDRGTITTSQGSMQVEKTFYKEKCILHAGVVTEGVICINTQALATYDLDLRARLKRHHTATHLLHAALKALYGESISQQGSSVQEAKLRFDCRDPGIEFNLQDTENKVNEYIFSHTPCVIGSMSLSDAKRKNITMMDKCTYGEEVRILDIHNISIEACGGTHVNNTSELGLFKIISSSKPSAGIRRIEAICGEALLQEYHRIDEVLDLMARRMSCAVHHLPDRITHLIGQKQKMEADILELQQSMYQSQSGQALKSMGGMLFQCFTIPKEQVILFNNRGIKEPAYMLNIESHGITLYFFNPSQLVRDRIRIIQKRLLAKGNSSKRGIVLRSAIRSIEEIAHTLDELLLT